ncbi:MAG: chemotaxis-specific protein-glutamate methyltransferase CheB [Verrucomicrobiota bacterium]
MRIALVNDMAMAIEALRYVLLRDGRHEIAWTAHNGVQAVNRCREDTPDLILMDLVMPQMNGAEATREIMQQTPCGILVVTASVDTHGDLVYEAMGYGALDATVTPAIGQDGNAAAATDLLDKIDRLGYILGKSNAVQGSAYTVPPMIPSAQPKSLMPPLLAIGASTGGPQAIATILGALPEDFPAAIVIVQHVDADFAAGFADWLNQRMALEVRLASEGEIPAAGTVLIAGKDKHMRLSPAGRLTYTDEPTHLINRPSVDVLFKSVADSWPAGGLGLLLTGMGRDGAEGLRFLRMKGWPTLAQDETSCIVYGMPKAAVELDAVDEVLPLEMIAAALQRHLSQLA